MFVFTLVYLSPRSYNYMREKFNNNLPHPSTIRRWFLNSNSNGEPGICETSLSVIRKLVAEQKSKGQHLYCTLAFDEMSIRRGVQWLNSKKIFSGFITYGNVTNNGSGRLPVATNVLVFMLNGINRSFNLPVAFYFINNLDGMEKMIMITAILKSITDTGAKVLIVDFDGLRTNIKATEILGANFDLDYHQPSFRNKFNDSLVHVFFDIPHMLKLVRNTLFDYQIMIDSEGQKIEWNLFVKLLRLD